MSISRVTMISVATQELPPGIVPLTVMAISNGQKMPRVRRRDNRHVVNVFSRAGR